MPAVQGGEAPIPLVGAKEAGERELGGDKAGRIVEAMRQAVAARGIAGATFDQVSRLAGVSRGLLHYYFGTKERLLVEVVRREADRSIERLEAGIAHAATPEGVVEELVRGMEEYLAQVRTDAIMFYEMLTLAQRNDEILGELAALRRRTREHLAAALRTRREAGVLELRAEPQVVAGFLVALGDGVMTARLSEPDADIASLMEHAVRAARALLG